eukprot:TRINITY_DN64719_c0_g1_i1.p1 TRINITY_DN64719_c0_g1~~TRINITY_DN64719_c0_g1_i1.p1  ORF type:complete len:617 (+),score=107.23 TRINITY_DN64719_c0_g1_i1:92-1942(+)
MWFRCCSIEKEKKTPCDQHAPDLAHLPAPAGEGSQASAFQHVSVERQSVSPACTGEQISQIAAPHPVASSTTPPMLSMWATRAKIPAADGSGPPPSASFSSSTNCPSVGSCASSERRDSWQALLPLGARLERRQDLPGMHHFRAWPECRESIHQIAAYLTNSAGPVAWSPELERIPSSAVSPEADEGGGSWRASAGYDQKSSCKPALKPLPSASSARFSRTKRLTKRHASKSSQAEYAEPSQTALIFDWDDTLFPTTFLLQKCKLNALVPLADQVLPTEMHVALTNALTALGAEISSLIQHAATCGRVVLVTLARHEWVRISCMHFMPRVWKVIVDENVKVVYAQEGYHPREPGALEVFRYARMKARAITMALEEFYSQYKGQSWKNVISIGDSHNERLGTMEATEVYLQRKQSEISPGGGLLSLLAEVSGAALAELSAALRIQKVYRGHAARRSLKVLLLPHIRRVSEHARDRLRSAFSGGSSNPGSPAVPPATPPPEPVDIPKVYASLETRALPRLPQAMGSLPAAQRAAVIPAYEPTAEQSPSLTTQDGRFLKVRTKTIKMVDSPLISELYVQVRLLKVWLPILVQQDKSLDVDLNSLNDAVAMQKIEELLEL